MVRGVRGQSFKFQILWPGLLAACAVGGLAYGVKSMVKSPIADELLIAMILGMAIRTMLGHNARLAPGFAAAPRVFIPVGVVFYGAINLNFIEFAKINLNLIVLLNLVVLTYVLVIFGLGRLLSQRKQITYLTATGSAVCGASAIAITSTAVDAEPDDVSISLISVFIAAGFGLFIFLPFLLSLSGISSASCGRSPWPRSG